MVIDVRLDIHWHAHGLLPLNIFWSYIQGNLVCLLEVLLLQQNNCCDFPEEHTAMNIIFTLSNRPYAGTPWTSKFRNEFTTPCTQQSVVCTRWLSGLNHILTVTVVYRRRLHQNSYYFGEEEILPKVLVLSTLRGVISSNSSSPVSSVSLWLGHSL